jgi:hypothetical protein
MKTKNRLLTIATLALIAIAALMMSNSAQAFRPTAVEFHFGMVGITREQTARLNVVNVSREPIQLSLNFTDGAGRMIRQTVETLMPDQATFLDISLSGIDQVAGRIQIHASLEINARSSADVGRRLIPTLEVFDNSTGKTQIALGACDGSV